MSYEIQTTKDFERSLKKLSKRYRSLYEDYGKFLDSLQDNPFQGAELYPNIRKIRMAIASKGKGKAGSARVITANAIVAEQQGSIALLTLYDKSDAVTVDINIVKQMAKELGFDIKTAQLHLIILLRDGYNEESAARCGSDSVVRSD